MRLKRDSRGFGRSMRAFVRSILHQFHLELMLCCALHLHELFAQYLRLTR